MSTPDDQGWRSFGQAPPPTPAAATSFPLAPVPGQPYAPPTYAYPAYPAYLPPSRSKVPVWAIILVASVGGVVAMLILAAIAIPVFLNQRHRAEAAAYSITEPAQIDGFTRSTTGRAKVAIDAMAASLTAQDAARTTTLAYTDSHGAIRVIVAVQRRVVPPSQIDEVMAGEERGYTNAAGLAVRFEPVSVGQLGGRMDCARTSARGSVCVFANAGSLGGVILVDQTGDLTAASQRALAAVLHRS